MKNSVFHIMIAIFVLIQATSICAQTSSSGKKKKPMPAANKQLPILEFEDWKEFESNELEFKLRFPSEPVITHNRFTGKTYNAIGEWVEDGIDSTVFQSYVNNTFYLFEVRKHPKSWLPDGTNLGENYGDWLKSFILNDEKILGEKLLKIGRISVVEFVYQETDNDLLIHRAFVVDQKLFQILMQMRKGKSETPEKVIERNKIRIEKFFESLVLTEEIVSPLKIG